MAKNNTLLEFFNEFNDEEWLQKLTEDLVNSWPVLISSCIISFVIGICWLLLLPIITGLLVWTTILTTFGLSVIGALYFWITYWYVLHDPNAKILEYLAVYALNQYVILYIAIFFTATLFLILVFIFIFSKQLCTAISAISKAAVAIRCVPSIVFVSIFKYILVVSLFSYSVILLCILASSKDIILQNLLKSFPTIDTNSTLFKS